MVSKKLISRGFYFALIGKEVVFNILMTQILAIFTKICKFFQVLLKIFVSCSFFLVLVVRRQ